MKAILGAFGKAYVMTSEDNSSMAYLMDIQQYGDVIKTLIERSIKTEDYSEARDQHNMFLFAFLTSVFRDL